MYSNSITMDIEKCKKSYKIERGRSEMAKHKLKTPEWVLDGNSHKDNCEGKQIEIFENELKKHNLNWCKGECGEKGHKRGFVLHKDKTTVHYDSKIKTRSTLHGALHEIGHCINNEKGLKSWEREANAEKFANEKFKEFGISVPRKRKALGVWYVKQKKRHGDNIRRGTK